MYGRAGVEVFTPSVPPHAEHANAGRITHPLHDQRLSASVQVGPMEASRRCPLSATTDPRNNKTPVRKGLVGEGWSYQIRCLSFGVDAVDGVVVSVGQHSQRVVVFRVDYAVEWCVFVVAADDFAGSY